MSGLKDHDDKKKFIKNLDMDYSYDETSEI